MCLVTNDMLTNTMNRDILYLLLRLDTCRLAGLPTIHAFIKTYSRTVYYVRTDYVPDALSSYAVRPYGAFNMSLSHLLILVNHVRERSHLDDLVRKGAR